MQQDQHVKVRQDMQMLYSRLLARAQAMPQGMPIYLDLHQWVDLSNDEWA